MSPIIVNEVALARIVLGRDWADINELWEDCKREDVFGAKFYDGAIERAGKALLRRLLRSGKVKDERGRTVQVASIIIQVKDDKGNVKNKRVYKQELLFDIGDCIQVINYWRTNRDKCGERIRYYSDLAVQLHGPQVQGMLPFD
jgi:hypothetical protein